MPTYYHITVRGHLDAHWSPWFDDLAITNQPNGEAVLAGPLLDQAALHGVLVKLRDLGLPLIAVASTPIAADAQGSRGSDGQMDAASHRDS